MKSEYFIQNLKDKKLKNFKNCSKNKEACTECNLQICKFL